MLSLLDEFEHSGLPVGAVQYDSWWYYKGDRSGIALWEAMPSTLGGPSVNGR